jgi:hypothetical protein
MRTAWPFIIKAKAPLLELLPHLDDLYKYLAKDLVITAELSDRHGLEFPKIFEQIKEAYLESVRKNIPQINILLGFDYYWSFERYDGRVITLNEVLLRADLIKANTNIEELNYLIQLNVKK